MSKKRLKAAAGSWLLVLLLAGPGFAQEVFTLGEVVVTGEQQVVNLATTVTEITAEDMKQRGARTVAEALQQLPGVYIQAGIGKGDSNVSIRGFNDTDVKILVDGVPVYEQYSRQIDLGQFNLDNVSKITVTKGASSVMYGPNAMGGVINIVTKVASKPTASLGAAWGDYGTEQYSLSAGAPFGDFNAYLGYSYRHSDGWRLSSSYDSDWWFDFDAPRNNRINRGGYDDGGKREGTDYLQHHINAKIGYEPNQDTKLYLNMNYFDNERGVPTRYFLVGREVTDRWRFPKWQQMQLSLVGEQKVNDWLRLKGRGFYVDHQDTLYGFFGNGPWILSSYKNHTVGGELQAFMDFGRWSFLKIGGTYLRDHAKQQDRNAVTGAPRAPKETLEADTYTFGIENEVRPLDWLAFVAGVSYDYYDPRKATGKEVTSSIDTLNPQGGVVVTLTESTNLHGSIGRKTRFPHLKELYSVIAGGNPDLKPQETITYEVGVTHAFSPAIVLKVSAFYNDIKNLIGRQDVPDPETAGLVSIYVNIGKATTKGVEVDLGADITDSFWAGLNYTYMLTEDKLLNRELEGRPRHRANLDLRYRFPFGLNLSSQLSYVLRQYTNSSNPIFGFHQSPDFLLVNARAEQRLGQLFGIEGNVFIVLFNVAAGVYAGSLFLTS
jgi:outer membrane receptor protein involved in Fe transport